MRGLDVSELQEAMWWEVPGGFYYTVTMQGLNSKKAYRCFHTPIPIRRSEPAMYSRATTPHCLPWRCHGALPDNVWLKKQPDASIHHPKEAGGTWGGEQPARA